MPERGFTIRAEWDDEAGVWFIAETDLPGLVAEAETQEALLAKIRALVPGLVEMNRRLLDWEPSEEAPIHFTAEVLERVSLKS